MNTTTPELETNTPLRGICGGYEHTDQHRHLSVTEMELCAAHLDYEEQAREGMEPLDDDYYRDLDWE